MTTPVESQLSLVPSGTQGPFPVTHHLPSGTLRSQEQPSGVPGVPWAGTSLAEPGGRIFAVSGVPGVSAGGGNVSRGGRVPGDNPETFKV